jgi:hypothetical protein
MSQVKHYICTYCDAEYELRWEDPSFEMTHCAFCKEEIEDVHVEELDGFGIDNDAVLAGFGEQDENY